MPLMKGFLRPLNWSRLSTITKALLPLSRTKFERTRGLVNSLVSGTPKDPPVLSLVRRENLAREEKFGPPVAKRYGECSEMFVFLMILRLKNGTDSKEVRRQQNSTASDAVLFFVRKGPVGHRKM